MLIYARLAFATLCGLLLVLAYHATLSAGFVYEDTNWLPLLTGDLTPTLTLPLWTYQAQTRLFGSEPGAFHLMNVALHALNGWLVWRLAITLTRSDLAAGAAAFIFLFTPMATEAVAYVSGRPDLLATTCVLLAVLLVLTWPTSRVWVGLGLACAALAMTSKASAVFAMPLVVWTILLFGDISSLALRPVWAFGGVTGVLLVLMGRSGPIGAILAANLQQIVTFAGQQAAASLHLTWMVVSLQGFTIEHDDALVATAVGYAALGLLVAVAAWCLWHRRTQPLPAFLLGWALLVLLPRLVLAHAFIPQLPEYLHEKQWYAALPALALGLGLIVQRVFEHDRVRGLPDFMGEPTYE